MIGDSSGSQDSNFLTDYWCNFEARWSQAVRHMWGSLGSFYARSISCTTLIAAEDTGYVLNRILTLDFGVSPEREIIHRLHRVEMRQLISESVPSTSTSWGTRPTVLRRGNSDTSWVGRSIDDSESETASSGASTVAGSGTAGGLASSSYSYTSIEEEQEYDPSVCHKQVHVKKEFYAKTSTRLKPIIFLAARIYEAHLMIVHLTIVFGVLVVIPGFLKKLESYVAYQSLAWGRSTAPIIPMQDSRPVVWSTAPDAIVPTALMLSQRSGLVGALAAFIVFLFHDLYHREAARRWQPKKGEVSLFGIGFPSLCLVRLLGVQRSSCVPTRARRRFSSLFRCSRFGNVS